jgi:hypothetical protein
MTFQNRLILVVVGFSDGLQKRDPHPLRALAARFACEGRQQFFEIISIGKRKSGRPGRMENTVDLDRAESAVQCRRNAHPMRPVRFRRE